MKEYAKIQKLIKDAERKEAMKASEIEASMKALAKYLSKGKEFGRFQIIIYDRGRASHYCLDLVAGDCHFSKTKIDQADFGIGVSKETWVEVARGELSPVDAFLLGRMEVFGDLSFGKRIYAKAARKGGNTEFDG